MMIDRHIDEITSMLNETFKRFPVNSEWFRKSVIFLNINNVNEYITSMKTTDGYFNLTRDFPNIALPWPHVWSEYETFYKKKDEVKTLGTFATIIIDDRKEPNGGPLQYYKVFAELFNGEVHDIFGLLLELNSEGKYIPGLRFEILLPTGINEDDLTMSHKEYVENGMKVLGSYFLANSFCHCKGITIEKSILNKSFQKSRIKRGKLPFFRFNTIVINPMREVLKREGKSETLGLKKALHICRGHFATYTQEAPLFGRVTGTFWKPMHVRGNAKEGVVVKDYKILPPSTSQSPPQSEGSPT